MARSRQILFASRRGRWLAWAVALVALAAVSGMAAIGPRAAVGWTLWSADLPPQAAAPTALDHLVVSEVTTGGASASDEFIELYNPAATALPLEGLEIIYVTASGATVTRKASWATGEPPLAPGAHLLVANEAGAFAAVADVTYANGLAATGGSVAVRAIGATVAIDAVGWGTATAWLEGRAAPAVAAGHSLERLPGGAAGSGQDGNDNAADFVDRVPPDPQNRAAPPIPVDPSPTATASVSPVPTLPPTPTPTAEPTVELTPTQTPMPTAHPSATDPPVTESPSPSPTPTPTPSPTASPTPEPTPPPQPMTVAEARALPDGAIATIEAVSLTAFDFADGGGCVADATAGIAVLVAGPSFGRSSLVAVSGEVDDRFHQRTLRSEPGHVIVLGTATEPEPIVTGTGAVGEALECRLVTTTGTIVSSATQLSGAVAFDLDDGSGATRLVVPDASGIATADWVRGTVLGLRGVVLQRDSSGSATAGYRLTLRDVADVLTVQAPTPTSSPSSTPAPSPSPGPSHDPSVVSIEAARRAAPNSRLRVRGVVTLPTGVLGDGTAAIQDATGAIILRLSDEAGQLAVGDLVQVDGIRSTKSGMETLRVSDPPQRLGSAAAPDPARHATGALGEPQEAHLVVTRGAVMITPRRTSAQNVYFDIDDGSGPLRVFLAPGAAIDPTAITAGSWVEIVGVIGQETTGQQPLRGYRLWPRRPADLRSVTPPSGAPAPSGTATAGSGSGSGTPGGAGLGSPGGPGATAAPAWPPGIPAPRLAAPAIGDGTPAASPSPTSDPRAASATAAPDAPIELLLLVAAGVLGAVAAVAAARPGTLDRLRLAIARPTSGDARTSGTAREEAPSASSPVEAAIATLVPLRVVEESSVAEDAPSVTSRSAVRRILPPT